MEKETILSVIKIFFKKDLIIILCYIFLALFFTFPLALDLGNSLAVRTVPTENPISSLVEINSDAFYQAWNLWFFKYNIIDLEINPLSHSDMVYYPSGFNNTATGYENLFNIIISIPLQVVFNNAILVYNILIIFNFLFAAYSTYLLAKYLTSDRKIAFLAGIIFAFSPFMMARSLGHLNLFTTGAIPLFILFYLKLLKEPSLKNSLYAALFFFLTAISSWHYAPFTSLFIALSLIFFLFNSPKDILSKYFIKRFLLFTVLAALFVVWAIYPFLRSYQPDKTPKPPFSDFIDFSADPFSYLTPPPLSNFGGQILNINSFKVFSTNDTESTTYLGFLEIAIFFFCLLKRKKFGKEIKLWLFLTASFFIFSLGPFLKIFGKVFHSIPLPYYLLNSMPIFSFSREPARLSIFIMLFIAIIFSIALKHITSQKNFDQKNKIKILAIAGLLIVLERIIFPYPASKIEIPSFYYEISKDKENYAILDLPDDISTAGYRIYNLYQIIHKKRITSGTIIYTALTPDVYSWISKNNFLKESVCPDETQASGSINRSSPEDQLAAKNKTISEFRTINIKYAIIHKELIDRYEKYQNRKCTALKENIDFLFKDEKPAYEDSLIKVYDLSKIPAL